MPWILASLREWHLARAAFLAVPPVGPGERFPREVWDRLGRAEQELAKVAASIDRIYSKKEMAAPPGIDPGCTESKSAASPLGQGASILEFKPRG